MQQTRGMVRHEAKRVRRGQQLRELSLIVGLDIGKTRHAVRLRRVDMIDARIVIGAISIVCGSIVITLEG